MANMIDISKMITNELPVVKITDDIIVTVNNRKSTILNIQAMAIEVDKKAEEGEDNTSRQAKFMQKALGMLVGQENAEKIEALNLPMPEYSAVYQAIMGTASGTYEEEATPSKQ